MNILVALALVVSGFLDMKTTNSALERGATEKNPLWRWVQAKFGSKWGYGKMAVHVAMAAFVYTSTSPVTWIAGGVLSVMVAVIALHNTQQGRS